MKRYLTLVLLAVTLPGSVALATRAPAKARPKPPEDAITEFAGGIRVGPGQRHANLTLFPVFASGVVIPKVDLTLERATALELVEISELKQADVNRIRIRSRGKKPILLIAGEMLRGGKQDRIVTDDLILPAGAELVIRVYCVEHGRWAGAAGRFSVGGHSLAGPLVRGAGARGGQEGVWSKVAEQQERLRAPSATGALSSVHVSAGVRDSMKPYLRALSDLAEENPKASGVVAVVDDEILAADLFSSPSLFRQLWPQLLEAYVIDALDEAADGERPESGWRPKSAPTATRVHRWLRGVETAHKTFKDTPGDGALYELRGRALFGSALVYENGLVHMELFPSVSVQEPEFNPLRFRRERLRGGD